MRYLIVLAVVVVVVLTTHKPSIPVVINPSGTTTMQITGSMPNPVGTNYLLDYPAGTTGLQQ